MKYSIAKAVKENDLVSFSWLNTNGIVTVEKIDHCAYEFSLFRIGSEDFTLDEKSIYENFKGIKFNRHNLEYDKRYPIVFYKKCGDNYIGNWKYINNKWIKIKEEE